MIFQPRKDALYRLAIEHGVSTPGEISKHLPLGSSVPKPRLEGWLHQFFRLPKTFSTRSRHVNRFKLGADPEFVLAEVARDVEGRIVGSSRADASALGLAQGPAFGADNNGRLAEIRPHPSRSAVEVLASILCTLRWLAICNPQTLRFEWLSGAYLMDDGLGGHVHFGRKRPTRKEEVAALDAVEECLLFLGVYPQDQVIRRRGGDARRQIYGALGDYRLQAHGYEYRTFPSWLDSPELAFITLVVAKLAVQMPGLFRFKGGNPVVEQARLRNFLAYFKGVDDDARLALVVLEHGLPKQQKGSFAPRWGITAEAVGKPQAHPEIIPPSIKPDSGSVTEIFNYLLNGKPLAWRVPEITWAPTRAPKGYKMCLQYCNTIQAKGLGEMIWDLCCSQQMPIHFSHSGRGEAEPRLWFSKDLVKLMPPDWKQRFEGRATMGDMKPGSICTSPMIREGAMGVWLKRKLLEGMLPLWRAKDCNESSFKEWQKHLPSTSPKKLVGKVLFESQSCLVGPLAT
jgi:hypothetical protein